MKNPLHFIAIIVGILCVSIAPRAFAASLLFSPDSGSFTVGQTFTVVVNVSSPTLAVNAFSGEVSYPGTKLKVVSVSKANSIVDFWTTSPATSSSVITFEGVALNPGYTGNKGGIVRITFRALAPGEATLKFKSSSVLANDGLGTNALSGVGTATYTITSGEVITPTPEPAPANTGLSPDVTSSTHPDQTAWYQASAPLIAWTIPTGVLGVGLAVDQTPGRNPSVHSLGRVTGYNVAKLTDGVWYAHVKYLTSAGWGPSTHYRFGIDTTPPSEFAVVANVPSKDSVTATLSLKAVDVTSGIDHYTFSVDGASPITVPVGDTWQTPELSPGEHIVEGVAYDKAGNSLKASISFTTTGILPPTIDTYPKELKSGDTLIVTGHTYPNAVVVMSIQEDKDATHSFGKVVYENDGKPALVQEVTADDRGVFTFIFDRKVSSGTYTLSTTARIGAYESVSSDSVTVNVTQSFLMRLLGWIIQYFNIIVSCIAIISLFISVMLYREIKKIHRHIGYPEGGQKPVV